MAQKFEINIINNHRFSTSNIFMNSNFQEYDNSWYKPGKKLKIAIWYFINILFFINKVNPLSGLKIWILRRFGAKIGIGVLIKPGVNIKYPWFLTIGDYTWIGEDVWIDNLAEVKVGSNCCISQGAMLLCGNHNFKKSSFDLIIKPITLEDGVWIGAKSMVCPGVTAKSHSVLTVGSIISKDMEPYTIYRGNPATAIKNRIIE